jgi:transgelin
MQMNDKYDPVYEREALDWIEVMTGENVPDIDALQGGIILCKLMNKIRPGMIKFINIRPIAVSERVCK